MWYKQYHIRGREWMHKVYCAEDLFNPKYFRTKSYERLAKGTEKYTGIPVGCDHDRSYRRIFLSALDLIFHDIIENGDVFVPYNRCYEMKVAKVKPWRRTDKRGAYFEYGFKDIQVALLFPYQFKPKRSETYLLRVNIKAFRRLWDKIKSGFKYEY